MSQIAAPAGLAGRAVRGGAILAAARLVVQVGTWSVTLLVARALDRSDYGIMTWGLLFFHLAEMLAEAGVGRALVQKKDLTSDAVSQAFTVSLLLSAFLYAVLYFAAGPVSAWLKVPQLEALLRVLGLLLWLVPPRTVTLALLDREQRLGAQAAILVAASAVQSTLVLVLAWNGAGFWALAAGALVAKASETLALSYAAGWTPSLAWPASEARALIAFGLWTSGASFLWFAYSNSDFAVVGRLFGPDALGAYALAFQLMSIPVERLTANVNQVAYPVFCRLQDQPARMRSWFLRMTVLLGAVGVPALAGMALVAPEAFDLLLGERWRPAVLPFQLLSLVGAIKVYVHTLPPYFNALGRPDLNFRYTFACALLYPPTFYLAGRLAGVPGVCVAWLILYPLISGAVIALTRPVTGISVVDFLRPQVPVLFAGVVMAGVVWLVRAATADAAAWVRLVAAIMAGATTYVAVLLAVGRRTVVQDTLALLREARGGIVVER